MNLISIKSVFGRLLIYSLLSGGLQQEIQGVNVTCFFNSSSDHLKDLVSFGYFCQLNNVMYTNETDEFVIVESGHVQPNDDSNVETLFAENSHISFVPVEIFVKFVNLENLVLDGVELKELENPLTNCERLKLLSLSDNDLKRVGKVFDECTQLIYIFLVNNKIATIDGDALNRMENLLKVFLDRNHLAELDGDFFEGNEFLKYVSIASNNFTKLPEALTVQQSLQVLHADLNPYTPPHDISKYFAGNFPSLKNLLLTDSNITEIKEGTFDGLVSLESLELERNQISCLHPRCLDPLVKLQVLYLKFNHIAEIDSKLFQKLTYLKKVFLYHNEIRDFAVGTFIGLNRLEDLQIDDNNYTQLRMGAFGVLPMLRNFEVSRNNLQALSSKFFDNFPNLKRLMAEKASCVDKRIDEYTSNELIYFESCFERVLNCERFNSVHGMSCEIENATVTVGDEILMVETKGPRSDVQYIRQTSSTFDFIPQILFDDFESLSRLELVDVGLKQIKTISNCLTLQHLNLNENEIEDLPGKAFENCISLRELLIVNNAIITIHEDAFKGLQLETLHIINSRDKLRVSDSVVLHPKAFQDQSKLFELFLSFQKAPKIENNLQQLSNLYKLNLEWNDIEEITSTMFSNLRILFELNGAHNAISGIQVDAFAALECVTTMDLSNNLLSILPDNLFRNMHILKILTLANNKFKVLPMISGRLDNLIELSFESNELISLATFYNFPQLRILNFSKNQIISISKLFFETMQNLRALKFLDNKCYRDDTENIEDLELQLMSNLRMCFKNFMLDNFCIFSQGKFGYSCKLMMDQETNKNINEDERKHTTGQSDRDVNHLNAKFVTIYSSDLRSIFEKFVNFEKVEMWKNSITKLNFFGLCSDFRTVDVRMNNLELDDDFLANCVNIKVLILVNNKIKILTVESFGELESLEFLDLSFNELLSLPEYFLNICQKLKTLKLSHNQLSSIDWPKSIDTLSSLDISHNEIKLVDLKNSVTYVMLKELHLNNNKINRIIFPDSNPFPNITFLNLADNELVALELTSKSFEKLQYLDVSFNRINSIMLNKSILANLTAFHATGNVCIDKSFECVEDFEEVLDAIRDC